MPKQTKKLSTLFRTVSIYLNVKIFLRFKITNFPKHKLAFKRLQMPHQLPKRSPKPNWYPEPEPEEQPTYHIKLYTPSPRRPFSKSLLQQRQDQQQQTSTPLEPASGLKGWARLGGLFAGTYNPITRLLPEQQQPSQSKQNQDKSEIQSVKNRLQTNYVLFKRTPHSTQFSRRVGFYFHFFHPSIHLCSTIRPHFTCWAACCLLFLQCFRVCGV